MEYTIKDICRISGQSARTIRYYDKIGLLTPEKIRSNGYRIYTERQLDILQQILFYRELDMELEQIKSIIYDEKFDAKSAVEGHIAALNEKKARIEGIIASAEKTLL
ncbi:MAG: MerR family transcriptional regulator, partial [Clostridia bacterium]|nr:MerR family transcriptional regulator [Clostridia bacterium]